MARRTQLEELQQFISDERLNDPDMLAALQAQGIDTSGLTTGESTGEDTSAETSETEATETLDAESPDAKLAELQAESDALAETDAERRKRDKLKADNDKKFQAAQQKAADELQHTLGSLQAVRQDTTGNVRSRVNALSDRLGSMATPGGIGVPLVILLALLVFLIPVMTKGGESEPRFIWAWKVLTRKAQLMPEAERASGLQHERTSVSTGNGNAASSADEAASVLALPPLSTSNFSQYFRG